MVRDYSKYTIFRRYEDFYDLQMKLIAKFPQEADKNNRSLPFIPGKVLVGKPNSREVAESRLQSLILYVRLLVSLPTHISRCPEVVEFFTQTQSDTYSITPSPFGSKSHSSLELSSSIGSEV